ncbi:MAG: hypothetical protein ACYDBV_09325 [Nitrospiria bacterium]
MSQKQKEKEKQSSSTQTDRRRGWPNPTVFIIIVILGLLSIALVFFSNHENSRPVLTGVVNPDTLPGIQSGEAPWPPELNGLRERLKIIGLPALTEEGSALHIHQHLDIFIHGKSIPVPAAIGFNAQERFISPIHTHDSNGVIHIESPTVQTFTLGQFLDIWGVRWNSKCIGSYCEDQQNSLKVFVNGAAVAGDPRSVALSDHQIIVITYGRPQELPNPIPSSYLFPPGS